METVEQFETSKLRVLKKFRTFAFYGKLSNICSTQREIIRFSTPGVIAMNFVGHWKIIVKNIRGVNRFRYMNFPNWYR